MAFPEDPRTIGVDLQLNGVWTNITDDVRQTEDIEITRGYGSENSDPKPSSCTLILNNREGKYSPRNPMGTYYGTIGKNTPIRVGLGAAVPGGLNILAGAGTNSYASTPDTAGLSITGDIDIRVEASAYGGTAAWDPSGVATMYIASKWNSAVSERSWLFYLSFDGTLQFAWSSTGTTTAGTMVSTVAVSNPDERTKAVRVTFDVNNGAGGKTATFYTAPDITGPWTQLGAPVTTAGTTSIFDSTSTVKAGTFGAVTAVTGLIIHHMQVLNGIAGPAVLDADFSTAANPFTDSTGLLWTLASSATYVESSREDLRFVGEVASWPAKWDTSGNDAWVEVEAAGILRRLNQSSAVSVSTPRKHIPSMSSLTAYWPLDEGPLATRGEPLVGTHPMVLTSLRDPSEQFGKGDLGKWLPASFALRGEDSLSASVDMGATTEWSVEHLRKGIVTVDNDLIITCAGGQTWTITFGVTGTTSTAEVTSSGGVTDLLALPNNFNKGTTCYIQFFLEQVGADVQGRFTVNNDDWTFGPSTLTYAAVTLQPITSITFSDPSAHNDSITIGHVTVRTAEPTLYPYPGTAAPQLGYDGEEADTRMARLCIEQGVALEFTLSAQQLGPQHSGTFKALIQEVIESDGSYLFETRDALGLAFLTREELYNASTALTLDYSANELAPPFEPVDDDQQTVNEVTVKNFGKGARSYEDTLSALSVDEPPVGVGRYSRDVDANLLTDDQAGELAAWYVHLGTIDEPRFPNVAINFANPSFVVGGLEETVLALDIGQRLTIENADVAGYYDNINLIVLGYKERLRAFKHTIVFVCMPALGYDVVQLDSSTLGKVDSGSSSLASDVTSSATSLSVATTDPADLWLTGAVSIPIKVGGETMTVTNISGASSPQTFTVTRSVNGVVKAQTAGTTVELARRATIAL